LKSFRKKSRFRKPAGFVFFFGLIFCLFIAFIIIAKIAKFRQLFPVGGRDREKRLDELIAFLKEKSLEYQ
jgi:hypothetical protein